MKIIFLVFFLFLSLSSSLFGGTYNYDGINYDSDNQCKSFTSGGSAHDTMIKKSDGTYYTTTNSTDMCGLPQTVNDVMITSNNISEYITTFASYFNSGGVIYCKFRAYTTVTFSVSPRQCASGSSLDVTDCSCDVTCPVGQFLDANLTCVSNLLNPNLDTDGDGILNKNDPDADGNGIADKNDPNSPLYNPFANSSTCGNASESPLNAFGSVGVYTFNQYIFQGQIPLSQCNTLLSNGADSILYQPDKVSECGTNGFCFAHFKNKSNCSFDPENYKPASDYIYRSYPTSQTCAANVDGVEYLGYSFIVPDVVNCTNTGFCFLQVPHTTPQPDSNTTTTNPDLNSTTPELSPLLQSQNNSNTKLDEIKTKLDKSNTSLEKMTTKMSDLLTLTSDSKKSLDKFSLDTGNFQSDSLGQQKETNTKLITLDNSIKGLMPNLNSISQNTAKTALNTQKINDALYADVGLNPDGTVKTGAESLTGVETTLKGSFSGFVQSNIFTFSNSSYQVPTITVSLYNHVFTLLDAQMMSSLDINAFRTMIIFIFALSGFITVFKTI